MGVSSSNSASGNSEGAHFLALLKPNRPQKHDKSRASQQNNNESGVVLHSKAGIIKRVSFELLWDNFLSSQSSSFVLSPAEAAALLQDSVIASGDSDALVGESAGQGVVDPSIAADVENYLQLVNELTEHDPIKAIDFMSICSSVLLCSNVSIEKKIDYIYLWMTLSDSGTIGFEEFFVSLSSFERGLSHALGYKACSEAFVRTLASQWVALADPSHRGGSDAFIDQSNLFDFCTNRQLSVRKLLEVLSSATVKVDQTAELNEVVSIDLNKAPKGGDEFMANPAWKKTAERMIPKDISKDGSKPAAALSLDWVHGYRGFDCRNNVYFIGDDHFVFSAAALSIVQTTAPSGAKQFYFGEHNDDVISNAVYDDKTGGPVLIATGEVGKKPVIHLYDYNYSPATKTGSFSPWISISGLLSKGVAQLAFSSDGKQLFAVDLDYTVAIYNTDRTSPSTMGRMIASSQGPKGKIYHSSSLLANTFISCGEKHLCIWTVAGSKLNLENVKLGEYRNKNLLSCVNFVDGRAIIGTAEGDLLLLSGTAIAPLDSSLTGSSSVNALWGSGNTIIAGLKDGTVLILNVAGSKVTLMRKFLSCRNTASNAAVLLPPPPTKKGIPGVPPVRAVSLSRDGKTLLIGSQECEVAMFSLVTGARFSDAAVGDSDLVRSSLVRGHWKGELWGLAVRPTVDGSPQDQYCTVGDDGYLRIWSIQQHRELFSMNMAEKESSTMARSCAYSPDGVFLAVSFGGATGKAKIKEDGIIRVYRQDPMSGANSTNSITIQKVCEIKEAKQWISVVRFSPDGSILVAGSRDNSIYIYSVTQQFKRKAKFSKHNAGINQLDFTADSRYLQSCCSGYEILFSEVNTGSQLTNGASLLKESAWHTWTMTLGWPVIGIWKGDMDGSDVNAVDRSPSGKLLATADDFGKVSLYRFPCVKDDAQRIVCSGHSSHVTCVRWASNQKSSPEPSDDYLISTGGEDKCVFQWKCTSNGPDGRSSKSSLESASLAEGDEFSLLENAPTGGDEFTAVKAWLGAICPPTAWDQSKDPSRVAPFKAALGEFAGLHAVTRTPNFPLLYGLESEESSRESAADRYDSLSRSAKVVLTKLSESGVCDSSAPDTDDLELDWIHGFRGFDTRNNVKYINSACQQRRVAYHAASMGVVLEPTLCEQRYFKGHTDDIMALAVHHSQEPTLGVIVATGQQAMGNIFVWKAESQALLSTISCGQKSVHMLEFSSDGRLLVSIAEDKSVAVSDWRSQKVLVTTKGEATVTYHISTRVQSAGANFSFLTVGDKHIRFWTLTGRNLAASKVSITGGKAARKCSQQAFLCVVDVNSQFFVGAEDGWIYVVGKECKDIEDAFCHHEPTGQAAVGSSATKGSPGGVTAMSTCMQQQLLVTGAKDGSVALWKTSGFPGKLPTVLVRFAVAAPGATALSGVNNIVYVPNLMAKQIQSLSIDPSSNFESGTILLVTTRGCDMMEILCKKEVAPALNNISTLGGGLLIRGHCNDELWGLATHPKYPEYCTVGDDKTLRFFSVTSRRMLTAVPLGNIARACAYSPEEPFVVAVGFGGRVGRGKESGGGMIRLYTSYDPRRPVVKLAETLNAKQWISNLKFSADGRTLVAGAHDNKCYIYDVVINMAEPSKCGLSLRTTFSKHNSVINHLDLSADGRFMQSTCSAYELLFSDTSTGKQVVKAAELRDVRWDTWTCPLGWPVQGIWSSGMDGSDINSVARSHTGHLVATSDDFGKVNVFRYPCTVTGAKSNVYGGHSSHVMNVRWTVGDEYLISVGGNDKCILQWRHTIAQTGGSGGSGESFVERHEVSAGAMAGEVDSNEDDLLHAPTGGDEAGAVKPWLGAIKTPSNPPLINGKAPNVGMELRWVHGYASGRSAANTPISANLFYNAEKDVVFHAAALGVKMARPAGSINETASVRDTFDIRSWRQEYFTGHDDDILCLAISSCRRFVATGQTASKSSKGKGSVCVWDALSCRLLARMDGCHQRGVNSVSFSPDGTLLLSVGMDDKNTHTLWRDTGGGWSRTTQAATEKGEPNQVFFSQWLNPNNPEQQNCHFFTGGNSLQFWKLEGANLSKKNGRFGAKYKQCPLLCAANMNTKDGWRVVIGNSLGDIYVFCDKEVRNAVDKAHVGPVLSLAEGGPDCLFLVSGGRDQTVKVWNQSLQPISSFSVKPYSPLDGSIAALDVRPDEFSSTRKLTILAGTQGGDVIEITSTAREGGSTKVSSAASGAGVNAVKTITGDVDDPRNRDLTGAEAVELLHSHTKGEQWGLATHPTDPDTIATVGDDGSLRLWSIAGNHMITCIDMQWPARSVAWHPSGQLLAVGFHEAVKGGVGAKKKKGSKVKSADGEGAGESNAHIGAVHIYQYSRKVKAGTTTHELIKRAWGCTSTAWIADVKFSPLGDMIAAGSHDKHLYVYNLSDLPTEDNFGANFDDLHINWDAVNAKLARPLIDFNKHSSAVLHVDFSKDGQYTQTNCQAGELLFLDLKKMKQEPSASKLADYNGVRTESGSDDKAWASQTCVLGWPVQGIWSPDKGLSDINAADRNEIGTLLATADDFGMVNIYRYPCVEDKSQCVSLTGHSSHVTNVRWTMGEHLISVGGNDKCTFIWAKTDK